MSDRFSLTMYIGGSLPKQYVNALYRLLDATDQYVYRPGIDSFFADPDADYAGRLEIEQVDCDLDEFRDVVAFCVEHDLEYDLYVAMASGQDDGYPYVVFRRAGIVSEVPTLGFRGEPAVPVSKLHSAFAGSAGCSELRSEVAAILASYPARLAAFSVV